MGGMSEAHCPSCYSTAVTVYCTWNGEELQGGDWHCEDCDEQGGDKAELLIDRGNVSDYTVAECYPPAIINGDESGLTDEESAELADWLRVELGDGYGARGHFATLSNESPHIETCQISGKQAQCLTLLFVTTGGADQ